MNKPWYQSKTIWLVIAAGIYKTVAQVLETKGIHIPPIEEWLIGGAVIMHRVTSSPSNPTP